MRGRAKVTVCAVCLAFAGCLVPPPAILQEQPPPPRATVIGTLWPPSDEPTFVVADRRIAIERGGVPVAETQTDRRGRFEVRLEKTGVYALTFSADGHRATVTQAVGDVYATHNGLGRASILMEAS